MKDGNVKFDETVRKLAQSPIPILVILNKIQEILVIFAPSTDSG